MISLQKGFKIFFLVNQSESQKLIETSNPPIQIEEIKSSTPKALVISIPPTTATVQTGQTALTGLTIKK